MYKRELHNPFLYPWLAHPKNALSHLSGACHECTLTCIVWTYVHVYLSKHIYTAPERWPQGTDFLCPLPMWEEMGISLLAMGLQIPCDLPFLLKPLHCPWLRTTRVASFLQVNVRKDPRAPGINNTKWLYGMFSFEWGKQERISIPFLWMKKLRFTHHTYMCVHMHILVRIKNILWCKLTQLFHCLIAMSPKSLAPSRNRKGEPYAGAPSWR